MSWTHWRAAVGLALILFCSGNPCLLAEGKGIEGKTTPPVVQTTFKPNPKLAAIPDNTFIDLGSFKWEKPAGEPHCGMVPDYSGMVYDKHNNRILMFGGGHSATWSDAIYAFSFETLRWKALYTPTPYKYYNPKNLDRRAFWKKGIPGALYPRPIGRHTYDLLVVPNDMPVFMVLRTGSAQSKACKGTGCRAGGGACGIYHFDTGAWEMVSSAKMGSFGGFGCSAEYDPVSKTVIGVDQNSNRIWSFDPVQKKSRLVCNNFAHGLKGAGAYSGCITWFPPTKKMLIFGGPYSKPIIGVWELDLHGKAIPKVTTRKAGDYPKAIQKWCQPAYRYDRKNRLLGSGPYRGNHFYAFDPIKGSWAHQKMQYGKAAFDKETKIWRVTIDPKGRPGAPGKLTSWALSYAEVDNVYIFIANQKIHGWNSRRVWAYRWKK